jgi:hypothetical protein
VSEVGTEGAVGVVLFGDAIQRIVGYKRYKRPKWRPADSLEPFGVYGVGSAGAVESIPN